MQIVVNCVNMNLLLKDKFYKWKDKRKGMAAKNVFFCLCANETH